jgi:hypothetical protein
LSQLVLFIWHLPAGELASMRHMRLICSFTDSRKYARHILIPYQLTGK